MMTRYFLRRPVTLTLSREQVLLGLKVYPPNIPFIKRPLRSPLKRVRQKLSFALAELNAPARQKEAPIILTELEIVAFRYYTEIASDFSNDDNWPKFTALSNALRFAAWRERPERLDADRLCGTLHNRDSILRYERCAFFNKVDTQRITVLNVHDLGAWKTNVAGTEEFCFRGPNGLLFRVSITDAASLPPRDQDRFLSIEKAIWRYCREDGHLLGAATPAADKALRRGQK